MLEYGSSSGHGSQKQAGCELIVMVGNEDSEVEWGASFVIHWDRGG
jgi:ethanolamine utilization microcompartment shell protein EutL